MRTLHNNQIIYSFSFPGRSRSFFVQMENSQEATNAPLQHTDKTPPYTPDSHQQSKHYIWQPGVFRHAPWAALLAIILGIGSSAASVIVIVISNHHAATWKIQPSVLLGFLAGFSATMLVIALSSGVAITWWRTALDPRGTTMARLHYIWNYGGSGSTPWLAGKRVNNIAVASILVAITGIAYSPLLQRASRIENQNLSSNITMSLDIFSQIPSGYSGTVGNLPGTDPTISWPFLYDIQTWYSGEVLNTWPFPPYSCNGTCLGSVQIAGLNGIDGGCSTTKQPLDLKAASAEGTQVFSINFTRYDDLENIPTLEIIVRYITNVNTACSATFVTKVCRLQLSSVRYPVLIQNSTIYPYTSQNDIYYNGDPYADPGDLSTALPGSPCGPLSALQWFGNAYYWSNATLNYNTTSGDWGATLRGVLAEQYFDTNTDDYIQSLSCGFQWTDPTEDVIQDFSQVLFIAAFMADMYGSDNTTQNFTAIQTQPILIYHSEYGYLAAATVVICIALIGVSVTLWGWWELGRDVSLSPLETAKALGAQMFQHWNLSMDGSRLAKDMGSRKFRYGEQMVTEDDGVPRPMLRIAELGIGNDPAEPSIPQLGYA